jgi:hypothetical protein
MSISKMRGRGAFLLLTALSVGPGICQIQNATLAPNFYSITPNKGFPSALLVSAVMRDAAGAIYAVGRTTEDAIATPGAPAHSSAVSPPAGSTDYNIQLSVSK